MVPINWNRSNRQPADASHFSSLDKSLPPPPPTVADMTTVLVGARQASFKVNRKLLCGASPFFRRLLEDASQPKPVSLWLPGESSTMFALFVEWVHSPSSFRSFLDGSVQTAQENSQRACQDVHWAIIRLHLFASHLDLYKLQDLAMDAIQDLYLNFDWDVPPSLILFLYTQCEALTSVRIRRWAVAMVAFSLTVGPNQPLKFHPQDSATSEPSRFRALFNSLPEFASDYATHVRKMKSVRLDLRFKNPQLRISANKLRNDERMFGFRECSFHSHRAAVGERRCPHAAVNRRRSRHISDMDSGARGIAKFNMAAHDELLDPKPRPLFYGEDKEVVAGSSTSHPHIHSASRAFNG